MVEHTRIKVQEPVEGEELTSRHMQADAYSRCALPAHTAHSMADCPGSVSCLDRHVVIHASRHGIGPAGSYRIPDERDQAARPSLLRGKVAGGM